MAPSRSSSDDDTPRERLIVTKQDTEIARQMLTLNNPSNHPRVKTARVWHSTIVTSLAIVVIGALAALQHWPHMVTLPALGAATGLWAFGALKR
jgi:cytochrome c-type biogenesis protein CcmH/NrfG